MSPQEVIETILFNYFYTGEPNQRELIRLAAAELSRSHEIECVRNHNNEDGIMSEGKRKITALEGTPEEIANYEEAFRMRQSPDWSQKAIPNDLAQDRYLKEAQALANGDARTEIAIGLWHHFAPESSIEWTDDAHKAEYLRAVDDITTGQLFNLLVSRINYDGPDKPSLTLLEIAGATDGANLQATAPLFGPMDRKPF